MKYHKIRVNKLASPPGLYLLELVGFKLEIIDENEFFVLDLDNFVFANMQFLNEQITKQLEDLVGQTQTSTTSSSIGKTYDSKTSINKNKYVPMNSKRKQAIEKITNEKKNMKNLLFNLAEEREARKANHPELYQNNPFSVEALEKAKYNNANSVWDQLKVYRNNMRQKLFYRKPKEITVKDLEELSRNQSMSVGPNDIKRLGIRSLELSNNFRKTEGKSELIWNDALYNIAMTHSKNMAEGKVPVGHDGFNDRLKQVPFFVRSFSENVAYNYNMADPVETAVIGWINSPGHRKNLLSESTHCAIGVYVQSGRYYFTQLFALC